MPWRQSFRFTSFEHVVLFFSDGGSVQGVNEEINSKHDRVDNLKQCLEYLESAGVDLTAIDAEGM